MRATSMIDRSSSTGAVREFPAQLGARRVTTQCGPVREIDAA